MLAEPGLCIWLSIMILLNYHIGLPINIILDHENYELTVVELGLVFTLCEE